MNLEPDSLKNLRAIPAFREFAQMKMNTDPELYRHEAEHGQGILQVLSAAVVAIGGEQV